MKILMNILLLACLFAFNAGAETAAPVQIEGAITVTPSEMFQHLENYPDMVFIDARRRVDYDKGHIKGAVQLLTSTLNKKRLAAVVPEKKTPILFYCQGPSCKRAAVGVRKALDYGYKRVYYYYGGLEDWRLNNYPLVTE